jgi:hypothetical protein
MGGSGIGDDDDGKGNSGKCKGERERVALVREMMRTARTRVVLADQHLLLLMLLMRSLTNVEAHRFVHVKCRHVLHADFDTSNKSWGRTGSMASKEEANNAAFLPLFHHAHTM